MARLKTRNSDSDQPEEAKPAAVEETPPANGVGLSPNPKTNLILADIALRGGGMLLRRSVERGLLGIRYSPDKAKRIVKGRSLTQTLVGTALARVATRSVPGALLVGGGLLAKTLYERRQGRKAELKGEVELAKQAIDGADT